MRRPRPEHGITSYTYGCRCEVCRAANNERTKRARDRKAEAETQAEAAINAEMGAHGSLTRYRKGCRCGKCRAANAKRFREDQADRIARLAADPSIREHGVAATYHNWGCRCVPCTRAAGVRPPDERGNWVNPNSVDRSTRKRQTRRERLMYVTGFKDHRKLPQPFGREWLNDDPVNGGGQRAS